MGMLNDYDEMWDHCVVTTDPEKQNEILSVVAVANINQPLYQEVGVAAEVPWFVVACIHFRETNQNFEKNLCNGDPLTARTIHVPVGRPPRGNPPFSWFECALDALSLKFNPKVWDISTTLQYLEAYNGFGYRHHSVNSPYLWDFTSFYTSGLFTSDGKFDRTMKEDRPGCVSILKAFEQEKLLTF